MRFVQTILSALAIVAQLYCAAPPASSPPPALCESLPRAEVNTRWDPRALAGEYQVTWVSDAGRTHAEWQDQLWLWPTSTRDSSIRQHQGVTQGDTATRPLYGAMRPYTASVDASRVRELRQTTDPIYPPVLLYVSPNGLAWLPDNPWAVLLIGTADNRRDGIVVTDGVGMAMRILDANVLGFRGNIGRWGIARTDSGHFCAQRIVRG
jgi:hypothetical protein